MLTLRGARGSLSRMRTLALSVVLLALAGTAPASAQESQLATIDAVHDACRAAAEGEGGALYRIEVEGTWRFGERDDEMLLVDTRRNLRAIGGHVELFASRLEPIGFVASEERAAALEAAREAGARLRIGFFLGFDEPDRSACVLRSRHGITTVRMDVAYLELIGADGGVLAREDTERFRAWHDDAERTRPDGPSATIEGATVAGASAPEPWRRALETAMSGALATRLVGCHREGIGRGAAPLAQVLVSLRVEARSGRVVESSVALSSLGDDAEARCVVEAVAGTSLPPGPVEWAARTVDLAIPVRLAAPE